MKRLSILAICTVVCFAFSTLAFATPAINKVNTLGILAIDANMANVKKLDHKPILDVPKWTKAEAGYEPNDWDGSALPIPGWGGDLGALDAGANVLTGTISSTGFDAGWYTGDTDFFGFALPAGASSGLLGTEVSFNPDCDNENDAIYSVWILATDAVDDLWILDVNFPYPYIAPVTCPFESSLLIDTTEWTGFYIYLGGPSGPATNYTITIEWSECPDADADNFIDDACGGTDCDDSNAFVHPCQSEIAGNGIDEDCSGADRAAHAGFDEVEPNDLAEDAQDLGSLGLGSYTIEANWCWHPGPDTDLYQFILTVDGTITMEITYDGVVYDSGCVAFPATDPDYLYLTMDAFDLDDDGLYDIGDYSLTFTITAPDDVDGDNYFSYESCGDDCDDDVATTNPCGFLNETLPADGADNDCNAFDWGESTVVAEVEVNDDYESRQDLGVLGAADAGYIQVAGDISFFNTETGEGDLDYYAFTLADEGFFFSSLSFTCDNDLDYMVGYEFDGELYFFGYDSMTYNVPEFFSGFFFAAGGWEFPQDFWILVMEYDGATTGVDYHLELYFEEACVDFDEDGYSAARQDETDWVDWDGNDAECGADCNDLNPDVNPAATEGPDGDPTCSDGIDNDCDGTIDAGDVGCDPGGSSLAFGPESTSRTLGHIGLILIPLVFVLGWRRRLN